DAGRDVAQHEDLGPPRPPRAVLEPDRHTARLERRPHRPPHVDMRVALAAPQLVALRGEAALELGDHPVDGREVLDRSTGQRPVELAERPLWGEAGGALDQVPLQLAAQVPLEAAKLLPGRAVTA